MKDKKMFDGSQEIGKDIYLYKSFLSKDEAKNFADIASSLKEEDWYSDGFITHSIVVPEIDLVMEKISSIVPEGMDFGPQKCFVRMLPGDTWGYHADNYKYQETLDKASLYVDGEPFELVKNSMYGIVIYYSEFEGGEIHYNRQDIEFKPSPGDMIVHSSLEHCFHGVKEVKSGIRYSSGPFIYNYIKVPRD